MKISAWYGLNFFAAEFGDIAVLPGGNAGLAEPVCSPSALPRRGGRSRRRALS